MVFIINSLMWISNFSKVLLIGASLLCFCYSQYPTALLNNMPSVYPNVNSNYRTNCQPAYAGGSTVIGGSGTSFGGGGAGIAIGGGAVAIGGGVGIAAGGGAIAIGGAGVGAGLGGVGAGFGNGNYGAGSLGVGGSSSPGGSSNSYLPGASSSSDSGTGPFRLPIPHCLTHAVDMLTCELCYIGYELSSDYYRCNMAFIDPGSRQKEPPKSEP
jgi:hypothetical protein